MWPFYHFLGHIVEVSLVSRYTVFVMAISVEDVRHIANLARLELGEDELAKFQKDLSSILEYISQLSEVKTEKVEPMFQTTGLKNVFREDAIDEKQGLSAEEATQNAPAKEKGYFKVKPVF